MADIPEANIFFYIFRGAYICLLYYILVCALDINKSHVLALFMAVFCHCYFLTLTYMFVFKLGPRLMLYLKQTSPRSCSVNELSRVFTKGVKVGVF